MHKGKIIDLNDCHLRNLSTETRETEISEELQKAIQHLIHRLRELGPLN